jgi:hypothetical protein
MTKSSLPRVSPRVVPALVSVGLGATARVAVVGLALVTLGAASAPQEARAVDIPGVNTPGVEYGIAFDASGQRALFTRIPEGLRTPAIYETSWRNGEWSEPTVAAFSGEFGDEHAFLTPDGERAYFSSKRPEAGGEAKQHNDLWYADRTASGWGQPVRLPVPINGDHIDSHPFLAADGTLYFHSLRNDPSKRVDIYAAPLADAGHGTPVALASLNTDSLDGEFVVHPSGDLAVFYSDRDGSIGDGDLYFVRRVDGEWGSPFNAGPKVNGPGFNWGPSFSPDGQTLYYAIYRDRDSDIVQIPLAEVLDAPQ